MNATTGGKVIWGVASSANGLAGLFLNTAAGNILIGQVGPVSSPSNVFRVDGTGKGFFDGGTQTGGADFAEAVAVAKEFAQHEPGDLLIVDTTGKRQLKLSAEPYSTLVAGIYSTKPGVLATSHKMDETAANEIPLAIVGIVPCKVSAENGPIRPGDLLVSSSTPGHAMKGTDRNRMLGAVVGKALEPMDEGTGVIQVLVTLQ
jgi:trimeric autotransporter adhesin